MKVYLAGPITGLTYDEGQDWRELAARKLGEAGISAFSPLRAKNYLRSEGVLQGSYDVYPLSSEKGITTRDRWDCMTADLVFMNLLGAKAVSVGTCIEFGWADAFRKPIVLAIEEEGNIHDHPMVRAVSGFRVSTLRDGLQIIKNILIP